MLRRHSLAVITKVSLKARANGAEPENPQSRATSVTDLRGAATSCCAARSTRSRRMYWAGVSPTKAAKMRRKQNGEKAATRASSSSVSGSPRFSST